MAFITDLNHGHQSEDFVIKVFEAHGYELVQKATGYFPDWDFSVLDREGNIKTIEVKTDRKAHKTGNFFYEKEAIEHSKADIIVYCYGQPISKLYFYHLPTLYTHLRGIEPNSRGGDNNGVGWLFPIESFNPKIVEV